MWRYGWQVTHIVLQRLGALAEFLILAHRWTDAHNDAHAIRF